MGQGAAFLQVLVAVLPADAFPDGEGNLVQAIDAPVDAVVADGELAEQFLAPVHPRVHPLQARRPKGILAFQQGGFRKVEFQHGHIEPQIQYEQGRPAEHDQQQLDPAMSVLLMDFNHQGVRIQYVLFQFRHFRQSYNQNSCSANRKIVYICEDMAKTIYTMGEVADILGENTSAVRYWSNAQPVFRRHDPVAAARLGEDRRSVESRVKALDCLKRIREELLQVRAAL